MLNSEKKETKKEAEKEITNEQTNKKRKAEQEGKKESTAKKNKKEIAKPDSAIPTTVDFIPKDVVGKFFKDLDRPSLASVNRVSKKWHEISQPIIESLKHVDNVAAYLITGKVAEALKYLNENQFDVSLFTIPEQVISQKELNDDEVMLIVNEPGNDGDVDVEQNLLNMLTYIRPADQHKEIYMAIIDLLIKKGVDVNFICKGKYSLLMTTIEQQNELLFDKLINLPQINIDYCIPGLKEDHCAVVLAAAIYETKSSFLEDLLEKKPLITQDMVDEVTEQGWQEAGLLINPYVFDRFGELYAENKEFKQENKKLQTRNIQLNTNLVGANKQLEEAKKHILDLTEELKIAKDYIQKIETPSAPCDEAITLKL